MAVAHERLALNVETLWSARLFDRVTLTLDTPGDAEKASWVAHNLVCTNLIGSGLSYQSLRGTQP